MMQQQQEYVFIPIKVKRAEPSTNREHVHSVVANWLAKLEERWNEKVDANDIEALAHYNHILSL